MAHAVGLILWDYERMTVKNYPLFDYDHLLFNLLMHNNKTPMVSIAFSDSHERVPK